MSAYQSTNRTFGAVMSLAFAVLATLLFRENKSTMIAGILLLFSFTFVFFAIVRPEKLTHLNSAWLRFGFLLGKITNPLVVGILFFLVLTPYALLGRLIGRDELAIKKSVNSNWVARKPAERFPTDFKKQF